jgi:hypothetical protein
MQRTWG